MEIYSIKLFEEKKSTIIVEVCDLLQIENEFFNDTVKREQTLFLCNSSINENKHYDDLRKILSKVMYEYSLDKIENDI